MLGFFKRHPKPTLRELLAQRAAPPRHPLPSPTAPRPGQVTAVRITNVTGERLKVTEPQGAKAMSPSARINYYMQCIISLADDDPEAARIASNEIGREAHYAAARKG